MYIPFSLAAECNSFFWYVLFPKTSQNVIFKEDGGLWVNCVFDISYCCFIRWSLKFAFLGNSSVWVYNAWNSRGKQLHSRIISLRGEDWSIKLVVCPFVLFLLAIALSVLLRYTDSDYPFGIFKLYFLLKCLFQVKWPVMYFYWSSCSKSSDQSCIFILVVSILHLSTSFLLDFGIIQSTVLYFLFYWYFPSVILRCPIIVRMGTPWLVRGRFLWTIRYSDFVDDILVLNNHFK